MIVNFEDLRTDFIANKDRPYWTLKNSSGKVIATNYTIKDPELAFTDLEDTISRKAMGQSLILVQSEKIGRGNAANAINSTVKIGNRPNQIAGIGNQASPHVSMLSSQIASLQDQMWQDRMDFMQQKYDGILEAQDKEIEELKKGTGVNKFLYEKLGSIDLGALMQQWANITAAKQGLPQNPVPIITQQMPPQYVAKQPEPAAEGTAATDDTKEEKVDGQEVTLTMTNEGAEAVEKLHTQMGDKFQDNIIKLAAYAEQNPALLQTMLNQMENA